MSPFELLKEKALTRSLDEVARQRRELPWVHVEQDYRFDTPHGEKTLAGLFDGRRQLVVYHFMFGPDWENGCKNCSFLADHRDGALPHLADRDTALTAISRATLGSLRSTFNFDYGVSFSEEQLNAGHVTYNYAPHKGHEELHGISAFIRDDQHNVFSHVFGLRTRHRFIFFGDVHVPRHHGAGPERTFGFGAAFAQGGIELKILIACVSLLALTSLCGCAAVERTPTTESRFDASVPRAKQIALATSAAPPEISNRAAVYVLGTRGFEMVRKGTNGFTCLVDRQMQRKVAVTLEPKCFDAEGTRTFLPVSLRTELLRARGKTEPQIAADITEGYRSGRFHAPHKAGLIYMMSPYNVLALGPSGTTFGKVGGHLMFYAPYMKLEDLGYNANSRNMLPVLVSPGTPYAMMIVVPKRQLPE